MNIYKLVLILIVMLEDLKYNIMLAAEPGSLSGFRFDFYNELRDGLTSLDVKVDFSFRNNTSPNANTNIVIADFTVIGNSLKDNIRASYDGNIPVLGFYKEGFYEPGMQGQIEKDLDDSSFVVFPDYSSESIEKIVTVSLGILGREKTSSFQYIPKDPVVIDPSCEYKTGEVAQISNVSPGMVTKWTDRENGLIHSMKGSHRKILGENLLHFFAEHDMYQYLNDTVYGVNELSEKTPFSTQTIKRWFNSGILPGYTLPFSKHKKISHNHFVEMLTEYGIIEYVDQEIYTPGEVATKMGVSPSSVAKWVDSKELIGFLFPFSGERRIPASSLNEFVDRNGLSSYLDNKHYTTGEVSKKTGATPRTVARWIDSDKLGGFMIPGSRERRIPESELLKFLDSNTYLSYKKHFS
ncbi:MAG: excisionase family DNA binding protein [Patescibacteria group bacterium]|jgi:excisionase family DNA binding protein